jgi:hypothetical protein
MNKKRSLAVVFLVVAIVFSITSLAINFVLTQAEKNVQGSFVESANSQGSVQLIILPQKGREVNETK